MDDRLNTGIIQKWSQSPLGDMASVFRFSALPVHHRESVAEHTFYVSFFALVIARDCILRGCEVNVTILLQRCITHDLDESLTGDIIRPFKHSSPELRDLIHESASAEMAEQYSDLPGGTNIFTAWSEAKADGVEGLILEFADVWSIYMYLRREALLGNRFAQDKLHLIQTRMGEANWIYPVYTYAHELSVEVGELLEELK